MNGVFNKEIVIMSASRMRDLERENAYLLQLIKDARQEQEMLKKAIRKCNIRSEKSGEK